MTLGTGRGGTPRPQVRALLTQAGQLTPAHARVLRGQWHLFADQQEAAAAWRRLDGERGDELRRDWLRLYYALDHAGVLGELTVREAAEHAILAAVGTDLLDETLAEALLAPWRELTAA